MARQVALSFRSQWGIAITGYAVPVPALKIKSCFAYVAFAHQDRPVTTLRIETRLSGQGRVQHYYASTVIQRFIKEIAAG
jgi:nicotinamide mononucleotide (NMN) deamidase PncC